MARPERWKIGWWRLTGGRSWPPITVVLIALGAVQPFLVVAIRGDFSGVVLAALVVMAIPVVFLWRGSRIAWVVLLLMYAGVLASYLFSPGVWWAIAVNAITVVLLLWPSTRRWVDFGGARDPVNS